MLEVIVDARLKFIDILKVKDYRVFLTGLEPDDFLILVGGDGTLNRFANDTEGIDFHNEVLYFPNGTGNDFAHELGHQKECNPFPITEYLKDLPCVVVKGKKYRFINGVGYGIDGETILGVTSYTALSPIMVKVKQFDAYVAAK